MATFGQRLTECRKAKGLSQKELAQLLQTSHSVIGKYERNEMVPSVEAAKKLAQLLDTTVGYLVDETDSAELFKNSRMLQRLKDIENLPEEDKQHFLYTIDAMLRDAKTRQAYAS